MKLIDVYTQLRSLNLDVIKTHDVAALLKVNIAHASKLLERLAKTGQLIRVARGMFAFPDIDPLILTEYLTSPFPSYISLQSALYYHGMISQIPNNIYVASLARAHLYKTSFGSFSVHHINPDFFFGYQQLENNIKIATPEKALIDILYFRSAKSKLFASLPELELTKKFKIKAAQEIIRRIPSPRKKTFVDNSFQELLGSLLK